MDETELVNRALEINGQGEARLPGDDDTLKTAAGSTRLWGHRLLPKTRSAAVLFPFEVTA